MRSWLQHDRFFPPKDLTVVRGRGRQCLLSIECERIECDLADVSRRARYDSDEEYRAWADGAARALRLFRREMDLLAVWLAERRVCDAEALLREAREILKVMEVDGVEFEIAEQDFMVRCDDFFRYEDAAKRGARDG